MQVPQYGVALHGMLLLGKCKNKWRLIPREPSYCLSTHLTPERLVTDIFVLAGDIGARGKGERGEGKSGLEPVVGGRSVKFLCSQRWQATS